MEKMILEQEPTTRPQKGTITCENEIRTPGLAFANTGLANPGLANTGLANSGLANSGVANASLTNNVLANAQQPSTSRSEDGDGAVSYTHLTLPTSGRV